MSNDSIKRHKAQRVAAQEISGDAMVTHIVQGETYSEALIMARQPKAGLRKLNKMQYEVIRTGEVREYKSSESVEKSLENLGRTFRMLRELIRTNFTASSSNQLFLTLTYAENMQDEKRLYSDFDAFYKRLKRAYPQHKFEYIAVCEPQGRGAWHVHLMLKSVNQSSLRITNTKENPLLNKIWGHGKCEVEELKSDEVGAYYVAYFTDLIADDSEKTQGESSKKSKKRKKGERLKFYPKGFKFYRCSRGIKRPTRAQKDYADVVAEYGKPTYRFAIAIIDANGRVVNQIQRDTFRKPQSSPPPSAVE